jgi:hypothetical protein
VNRATRISAGTLVHATEITSKHIRAAMAAGIEHAAAELERKRQEERERQAAILALLLLLSKALAEQLKRAIIDGRQAARRASTRRVLRELREAGVDVNEHELSTLRPLLAAAALSRLQDDSIHAESSADALIAQWRGLAAHDVSVASRNGESETRALLGTKDRMGHRVDRTAWTETAQSYNDEHRLILEDAVKYDDALADKLREARIVRQWSAMLEACPTCAGLDGTTVEIGESFPGGLEPGFVHPNCRCIEILVSEEEAQKSAA